MSKNMAIVLRWSAFFGCCMGIVYCWAWDAIEQIVEGPLYTSDADLSYQIGNLPSLRFRLGTNIHDFASSNVASTKAFVSATYCVGLRLAYRAFCASRSLC